jgi:hypothetical protein
MNAKNKTIALMLTAIIVSAIVVPLAIAVNIDVDVGSEPPFVCCKWEEPEGPILPAACPDDTPVTIKACVCDGNDDITSVTATVRSPVLTLSDDEMGTQFAHETGQGIYSGATVTITDVPGTQDGVQFDFTNLKNAQGTVVGDNFAVSQKAGGAWKTYGTAQQFSTWGDFTNYDKYSLKFENTGTTGCSVNLKMNTGWTIPPPEYAAMWRDTYWEDGWTRVGAGETVIVTLDFSSATVYNAGDETEFTSHPDGTTGVTVWRLDEVSDIGFQVCSENDDEGATLVVSATGFTVQTVNLNRDQSIDGECISRPECVCTPHPDMECVGYSGTVNLDCCDPSGTWCVTVRATDSEGLFNEMKNTFELMSLKALDIDFTSLAFGTINPGSSGEVKGDDTFSDGDGNPTVKNIGNDPIDVEMLQADLTGGAGTILGSNMEGNVSDVEGYQSLNPAHEFNTNIECEDTDYIDFKLNIPLGTKPGSYSGILTITAK